MPISRLIQPRSPKAVLGGVRAIIVSALNRQALWPWAHIIAERLKRFYPSLAYSNAACTIPIIVLVLWIQTTLFHCSPDVPKRGGSLAVSSAQVARGLAAKASATLRSTSANGVHAGKFKFSTIAAKLPYHATAHAGIGRLECDKASKSLTCNIPCFSSSGHVQLYGYGIV